MSNIYLKVTTIETFSKLWFSGFKTFANKSVFGELCMTQISLNFKTSWSGSKTVRDFSIILILKEIMTFQSQRVHAFCWTKILKTKRCRKWKIPHTVLARQTLCFTSYKNRKLKIKLRWVGARKRKKRGFFVPFIVSEGNFLKICVYLNV